MNYNLSKNHFINSNFTSILILFMVLFCTNCQLFSNPTGESQIIQTYSTDSGEYHYLHTVIKVSNNGNKTIYQTTINIQADTNIRSYYKTTTSNLTIQPDSSIYITVDFSFKNETENNEEQWNEDSIKILSTFWN
ncbi:MAG: hypothetical protein K6A43_11570 [Treponema sp.]|nr:hypothetical protein [Treponema sp.]